MFDSCLQNFWVGFLIIVGFVCSGTSIHLVESSFHCSQVNVRLQVWVRDGNGAWSGCESGLMLWLWRAKITLLKRSHQNGIVFLPSSTAFKTHFCLKLQSTGCSTTSVPCKGYNAVAVMEQAALQWHQSLGTSSHRATVPPRTYISPSLTWVLQQQSKFCNVKGKQNLCDQDSWMLPWVYLICQMTDVLVGDLIQPGASGSCSSQLRSVWVLLLILETSSIWAMKRFHPE